MKNEKDFKLILVDPNLLLCEEWENKFGTYDRVEIKNDIFENISNYDCIVSPANSFGLMDGGVDLAITRYFGHQLQEKVQARISSEFYGEQPVGTSIIVETGNNKHPFLAHTPTMRVPMIISKTDNVYSAMFAMLRAVGNHNKIDTKKIKSVLCTGLGTATGRVKPKEAARQMEIAYKNFYNPPKFYSWLHISKRQDEIIFGGNPW